MKPSRGTRPSQVAGLAVLLVLSSNAPAIAAEGSLRFERLTLPATAVYPAMDGGFQAPTLAVKPSGTTVATNALGVASFGLFVLGGLGFMDAGSKMSDIRSISGTSTAEAYYQGMGKFSTALGFVCYGLAVNTAYQMLRAPSDAPEHPPAVQ